MSISHLPRLIARRISHDDVTGAARGFPAGPRSSREHLERRAGAFVVGAHLFGDHPDDPHTALHDVPVELRGFAYEGAAMVAALADLPRLPRPRHLSTLAAGPGQPYRHLVHVGVGWAMATVPGARPGWWAGLDPLLRWLAVDGAGFRAAFFHPAATSTRLRSMADSAGRRVWASGVGRALWFIHAADLDEIAASIDQGATWTHPELWAGVGLASVYAGAPDGVDPGRCRRLAGRHLPAMVQGMTFGVTAASAHLALSEASSQLYEGVTTWPASTAPARAEAACADLYRDGTPLRHYTRWQERLRVPPAAAAGRAAAAARGGERG